MLSHKVDDVFHLYAKISFNRLLILIIELRLDFLDVLFPLSSLLIIQIQSSCWTLYQLWGSFHLSRVPQFRHTSFICLINAVKEAALFVLERRRVLYGVLLTCKQHRKRTLVALFLQYLVPRWIFGSLEGPQKLVVLAGVLFFHSYCRFQHFIVILV